MTVRSEKPRMTKKDGQVHIQISTDAMVAALAAIAAQDAALVTLEGSGIIDYASLEEQREYLHDARVALEGIRTAFHVAGPIKVEMTT